MKEKYSKTKTTFYRRLLVAHLISRGVNTVPLLESETGMNRRTLQGTILALPEIDIQCKFTGANKNGMYSITSWGMISKKDVERNLMHIKKVLELIPN